MTIRWYLLECGHYGSSDNGWHRSGTAIACAVCPKVPHERPVKRRIVKRVVGTR